MDEWEKYKIKGDLATAGTELNTVRHIVHVPPARRYRGRNNKGWLGLRRKPLEPVED